MITYFMCTYAFVHLVHIDVNSFTRADFCTKICICALTAHRCSMYTYSIAHTSMYIYAQVCLHTCIYVQSHKYAFVHTNAYICVKLTVHRIHLIYAFIVICLYLPESMSVYMYLNRGAWQRAGFCIAGGGTKCATTHWLTSATVYQLSISFLGGCVVL